MPEQPSAVALAAEDEPLVRMEAADVLGDAGFDVLEASTTSAALAYLETHPETVQLFTDIVMPGPVDGLALAREVQHRWPEVKIIIVSGRVTPNPAQLPEGARFPVKPYYSKGLAQMVRERASPKNRSSSYTDPYGSIPDVRHSDDERLLSSQAV